MPVTPAGSSGARAVSAMLAAFLAGGVVVAAFVPDRRAPATVTTAAAGASAPAAAATDTGAGATTGGAATASADTVPTATSIASRPAAATAGGGATPSAAGRPAVAAAAAPAPGDVRAAPPGGNGGATFQGVTATAVKVVQIGVDSNALGAACPRCGDGQAPKLAEQALIEAWRRDGKLPIYGRDFDLVDRTFGFTAEEARSACTSSVKEDKPFIVTGQAFDTSCMAHENHILSIMGSGVGASDLYKASAPYLYSVQAMYDVTYRNFVHLLDQQGLVKGQVIGLYSSNALASQVKDVIKPELAKLGAKIAAEVEFDATNTPPSDPVAVQRFRTSGVTVALLIGASLTEPAGFQQQAEAQGYRPKYPIAGAYVELVDAVADVAYNAAAEDGNIGMRTQSWEWSQRKPARFAGNATAQYCLDAYSKKTGKVLDVYDGDAEINQLLSACASLEVARQAIVNAGPKLTQETFLRGLYQIKGMETSECPRVSFGPGKYSGQDSFAMVQFKRDRWQPENNLWHTVTPWRPWFVG